MLISLKPSNKRKNKLDVSKKKLEINFKFFLKLHLCKTQLKYAFWMKNGNISYENS